MKRCILGLLLAVCAVYPAWADFKYTEETKTEMQMPPGLGMMAAMMQNQMQNNITLKTVYMKGKNKRVDYPQKSISVISKCDQKLLIVLDHRKKIYNQKSFNADLKNLSTVCDSVNTSIDSEELKQAQKALQQMNKPLNNAKNQPVIMKESIIDTKMEEVVGTLKAHKYIKETSITGNPSCMPTMKTTEYVWTVPMNVSDYKCQVMPATLPNLNCYKMMQSNSGKVKTPDCFKNMKQVHEGLTSIPGYVVKTQTTVDTGSMMQGMQGIPQNMGMPTGRAAGILDAVLGTLGQVQGIGGQVQDIHNNIDTLTPDMENPVDPVVQQLSPQQIQQPMPPVYQNPYAIPQGYPPQQGYPYPPMPVQQGTYPPQGYPYSMPPQQAYPQPQGYPPYVPQVPNVQEMENLQHFNPADMKMVSTTTMTRTNISFETLPDSLFEVPEGYKLVPTYNPPEFTLDFDN